jgi:hypothetical protein
MIHVAVKLCSEAFGMAVKSSYSVTLNLDCAFCNSGGRSQILKHLCVCVCVNILSVPLGTSDILTECALHSTNCCQGWSIGWWIFLGLKLVFRRQSYGLDGRRSNHGGEARFSTSMQTGPGAHPASYTMGTGLFPGVKQPGCGVNHPPSSNVKVKERAELYLSSSLWYHGRLQDELYLLVSGDKCLLVLSNILCGKN